MHREAAAGTVLAHWGVRCHHRLDQVEIVNGFLNADPSYAQTTLVLNPFSDLIRELFGPEVGAHARTAIGVATVPLNLPLVVSAEVELS